MANNSLTTRLDVSPFYDDYNEEKDFYRTLFRPGFAVQGRELTQLQTVLQKQIDRLSENIFKEGSLVTGGQFIFDTKFRYVKLADLDPLTNPIQLSNFTTATVTGLTSGVVAEVFLSTEGTEVSGDPKTLYLKYISGGTNGTLKSFIPGETIETEDNFQAVVLAPSDAVGNTSIFTIESGVTFAKDHHLRFSRQSIIMDKYSDTPSCKVGFSVIESIVDEIDDLTLLDPAQGSYNFAAPGASRLKIILTLVKYGLDEETSPDFIELFEIKDGITQEKFDKTQYNVVRDYVGGVLDDTAGDFSVRGWNVFAREHLNTGTNQGLYYANTGGNNSFLAIGVDAGKGYIKGYDIETLVTRYVNTRKGLDTKAVEQQVVSTNYSNYVIVDEFVGNWPVNSVTTVSLYDTAQDRMSLNKFSSTAQTGTVIGTAKVKAVELISGIKGLAATQYRVYLYDIAITNPSFKFKDIRSLYIDNASNADAGADIVLDGSIAVLYEPDFNYGVYDIGLKSVKTIRDASNQIDTSYTFLKTFDVSIASGGTFTLNTGAVDEVFPYSTGFLNTLQESDFVLSLNASVTVAMTGTVAVTNGSPTVTGTSTFFTRLNVGDKIQVTGVAGIFTILSITSNTVMTLSTNIPTTVSGAAYNKYYGAGHVIDFGLKGAAAGTDRTIEVVSTTSAAFDMKETLSGSVTATVQSKINKVDAREIAKELRSNRYVIINAATAGTTGPYNLGVSDAFRLKSVRIKSGTTFSTTSEGTDVTSLFKLDSGQRDTHYDHASIIKAGATIANNSYLLVKFDYFNPDFSQGSGYFSVDSYPINDTVSGATTTIRTEEIPVYTSTVSSRRFDLRNCIDTRPVKTATAADTTSLIGITTNPATSTSFSAAASGLKTPAPNENFLIDMSYYLPRKDLMLVDKNGTFKILEGVSDTLPITPKIPVDSMALALINVAPYPSLVTGYASQIKRLDLSIEIEKKANRRYTHRDVGVIDRDVKNLQYYQAVSLLEKSVIDLKIPDENGLDRFKNGIFVDPFNDHSLGDLRNVDYNIAIDPIEKSIRPKFRSDTVAFDVESSNSVTISNGLVTLPYTQEVLINQTSATSTRNAAGFFWNFKGSITLNPTSDYWTDTTIAPSIQVSSGPSAQAWQSLADASDSVWGEWNTTWTGVSSNTEIVGNSNVTAETTTTSQSRSRKDVSAITTTQTENLGERVIDVGVIPFMRSRAVTFTARSLLPNTRVYPFFDGENVSAYCVQTNSSGVSLGTSTLISDANGMLYGIFYIPSNSVMRFRTGDRVFKLTDSFTNGTDSITTAESTYSASGLTQQKQTTFLTTVNPTFSSTTVSDTRDFSSTTFTSNPIFTIPADPVVPIDANAPNNIQGANGNLDAGGGASFSPGGADAGGGGDSNDPIAQTFSIDLPQTSHVFVTSLDLYFQTKHPTLGVTIELREIDAASNITGKVIPYSKVYVPSANINTSTNASAITNIPFSGPICLTSGQEYAFVVIPEQNNPNYRVFTAKLGEVDIQTGNRVTAQPYSGIFFASSNNKTWSPIQDEDFKFRMHRAKFSSNAGTFRLRNKKKEIIAATSISGNWEPDSGLVYGETLLTIGTIVGGTPVVGNKVVQGAFSATIISIASGVYRVRGTNAYRISNGSVSFTDNLDVSLGITGIVTNSSTSYTEFERKYYDTATAKNIYIFRDPTGIFALNEVLTRANGDFLTIQSFEMVPYSVIDFETSMLEFPYTAVKWEFEGTNSTYDLDTSASLITVNDNFKLSTEKFLHGNTKQIENSITGSLYHNCYLFTISDYLSPLIDLNRTYDIYVRNIINNDSTGEDGITGGSALNRYISQRISLEAGNDAEDMKIYLSAYKPSNSDILVYAKIVNAEDKETFENKNWFLLDPKTTNVFSNDQDDSNFREFEYNIPASKKTGPLGEVQYTNTAGVTFLGYRNYMIKVVLIGSNSALVPKVKDLRCLALQL